MIYKKKKKKKKKLILLFEFKFINKTGFLFSSLFDSILFIFNFN